MGQFRDRMPVEAYVVNRDGSTTPIKAVLIDDFARPHHGIFRGEGTITGKVDRKAFFDWMRNAGFGGQGK